MKLEHANPLTDIANDGKQDSQEQRATAESVALITPLTPTTNDHLAVALFFDYKLVALFTHLTTLPQIASKKQTPPHSAGSAFDLGLVVPPTDILNGSARSVVLVQRAEYALLVVF